jgi:ABC-type glycerol-3-phosphate transport system substrate-binding protein
MLAAVLILGIAACSANLEAELAVRERGERGERQRTIDEEESENIGFDALIEPYEDELPPFEQDPVARDPVIRDPGVRNLGGLNIDIGIWWTPEVLLPDTEYNRARLDYLEFIQEQHNFTIKEVDLGAGWGAHADWFINSIQTGRPVCQIAVIDPGRITAMLRHNLLLDLSSLPSVDFSEPKWNQHVREAMTFDGRTFGFVHGYNPDNAHVVFFNKDVLAEVGIDPYEPYSLQASGDWTWNAMLDMASRVNRTNDFFGFATFVSHTLNSAVFSNGASFVDKDSSGRFYTSATNNSAFLQAAEFIQEFAVRGLLKPQPEGSNWNWFVESFNEGDAAFRIDQEYAKYDLQNVPFDWGMVMFPKGPAMNDYMAVYSENIYVLPMNFSFDEADDIMFAYNLFTNPVPGYEDDDTAWKFGSYDDFRDARAVDETLAMLRSGKHSALRLDYFVPSFEVGRVAWDIWDLDYSPARLIESASQEWNAVIEAANRMIFGS